MSHTTIAQCLETIGVTLDALAGITLQQGFVLIKKSYHKIILRAHPDKGGDKQTFMAVRAAFAVLKDVFASGPPSFAAAAASSTGTGAAFDGFFSGFWGAPTPSWEFYDEAAKEDVPMYVMTIQWLTICALLSAAVRPCIRLLCVPTLTFYPCTLPLVHLTMYSSMPYTTSHPCLHPITRPPLHSMYPAMRMYDYLSAPMPDILSVRLSAHSSIFLMLFVICKAVCFQAIYIN